MEGEREEEGREEIQDRRKKTGGKRGERKR